MICRECGEVAVPPTIEADHPHCRNCLEPFIWAEMSMWENLQKKERLERERRKHNAGVKARNRLRKNDR